MILVAGATGSLGTRITTKLLERGESVRALVRPASDATRLEGAGARIVRGDLTVPATLPPACEGVHTIISTASASSRSDGSVENVDATGTASLVAAARAAGVFHFILISTIAASPDSPNPVFRAKGLAEKAVRESGMTWTIVQGNAFMDVWFAMLIEMPIAMAMPVALVGESARRHSFVAEADMAAFAVASIDNPAARNATLVIGGPEAVTFRDVVAAYGEALGREIEVRRVAPGGELPGLPPAVSGLAAALETFDSPIPMEETAHTFGVTLTGLRDFSRERVAAMSDRALTRPAT